MEPRFICYKAAAARLAALGVPVATRTVQSWGARYPELRSRIAGRAVLRTAAFDLILDGLPLAEVAAAMRALNATERPSSEGGDTGRE